MDSYGVVLAAQDHTFAMRPFGMQAVVQRFTGYAPLNGNVDKEYKIEIKLRKMIKLYDTNIKSVIKTIKQ